jgi:hypothetical protein
MFQVLYRLFLSKLKSEKTNGSINKKAVETAIKNSMLILNSALNAAPGSINDDIILKI